MTITYSKQGNISSIKDSKRKILKEINRNGVLYRYNPIYKTYNSIIDNSLLY